MSESSEMVLALPEKRIKRKKGAFEKAGNILRFILFPIAAFGNSTETATDVEGMPTPPSTLLLHGLLTLPLSIFNFIEAEDDSAGPLESMGREIDDRITKKKPLSFGGWRSASALALSGAAAFGGAYGLFELFKGLITGLGAATPIGAVVGGIIGASAGLVSVFSSYGKIKVFFEWMTCKKERDEARARNMNFGQMLILMMARKLAEFKSIFTAKFWQNNGVKVASRVLAAGFAAFIGFLVFSSLPFALPAVAALTAVAAAATYITSKGAITSFMTMAAQSVQRFFLGLMGKKTSHLHSKDPQDKYDNGIWNSLSPVKRICFGYIPSVGLTLAAVVPTILGLGFPPLGAALVGLGFAAVMFTFVYLTLKSTVTRIFKKIRKLPDVAPGEEDDDFEDAKPELAIEAQATPPSDVDLADAALTGASSTLVFRGTSVPAIESRNSGSNDDALDLSLAVRASA